VKKVQVTVKKIVKVSTNPGSSASPFFFSLLSHFTLAAMDFFITRDSVHSVPTFIYVNDKNIINFNKLWLF